MLETNTQDNSFTLIPLSHAAQLSGYHQDYLGQLCRLGKLQATKIGRNWFTSPEALNNLSATVAENLDEQIADQVLQEEFDGETETQSQQIKAPVIAENITISEVADMPIAIRTVPAFARNTNSVQNILTNSRIENLQAEVVELRRLLFNLMEEVKSHSNILQAHETINRVQDSLKHSYVSNFDFNIRPERTFVTTESIEQPYVDEPVVIHLQSIKRPGYVMSHWVAVVAAIVVLSFITTTVVTGKFFGSEPQVTSVYYHMTKNQPEVAGASTSQNIDFPTVDTGELPQPVVQ